MLPVDITGTTPWNGTNFITASPSNAQTMHIAKAIAKKYHYIFDQENNLWIDIVGIMFFSSLLILLFSHSG